MQGRGTGIALGLLLLVSAGCGDSGTDAGSSEPDATPVESPETFFVSGTLDLADHDGIFATDDYNGAPCTGTGGYADIEAGAQVVIRDSSGEQIALGELQDGFLTAKRQTFLDHCQFLFRIIDVPARGSIYSVEVTHRGEVLRSQRRHPADPDDR